MTDPKDLRDQLTAALPDFREPQNVWCTVHASTVRAALAALAAQPAADTWTLNAPKRPEPGMAEFILRMLVAAGHVPQAKVDEAYAIAAKMPAAPALPAEPVAPASQTAETMSAEKRFAGWFNEIPSATIYRLWEQGGHDPRPGDVALYEEGEPEQLEKLTDARLRELFRQSFPRTIMYAGAFKFARAIESELRAPQPKEPQCKN